MASVVCKFFLKFVPEVGYTRCNERVTEHEKGSINSRWRE